ncbi:MAG: hypothetical protein OEX10_03905 [Candidatus Bathyarchaeota archaeon]|nr:hypothetical protein [Candidatus Bathyarchaeota archaeon]
MFTRRDSEAVPRTCGGVLEDFVTPRIWSRTGNIPEGLGDVYPVLEKT